MEEILTNNKRILPLPAHMAITSKIRSLIDVLRVAVIKQKPETIKQCEFAITSQIEVLRSTIFEDQFAILQILIEMQGFERTIGFSKMIHSDNLLQQFMSAEQDFMLRLGETKV